MNPRDRQFEKLDRKSKKEAVMIQEPLKSEGEEVLQDNEAQKRITDDLHSLIMALRDQGFQEFVQYLHSPWRIMWTNLLAGVFRGLGILIGMTMIVGLIVWALTKMIDFPIIGNYLEILIFWMESTLPPEIIQQFQDLQNTNNIY